VAAVGALPAVTALVAAAPGALAAGPTTVDCSTTNLQNAIGNAAPGATLPVTGTCYGNFTIGKNLTLLGQGTAVLDGQQDGTTLTVSSGATVRLASLTVTDGDAGNTGNGGGINNSGTLTLEQSTVTNNSAGGAGNGGGGIYNSATLALKDTTVSDNSSGVFGGGIYNESTMTLENTTVSENSAVYGGGGILTGFGFSPVTLKDSTVVDNTAESGAGIFNILDSETLMNSTVSGNTATYEGGGINNNAGTTTLVNSTVTNNTAQVGEDDPGSFGGGVFDFSGTVLMYDSTVSGNVPSNCAPAGYVTGCTG
jgi:predicted outer membrane repeat protein